MKPDEFHNHLPPHLANDISDLIARALLLRFADSGLVEMSESDLALAAETSVEYGLRDDGTLLFRIERH